MNTLTATLAYDFAALEPLLSKNAIREHFMQHHAAACIEAASWVKGTDLERLSLESLIRFTAHLPGHVNLLRRACQIRNHNLYWQSLQPGGGNAPWGPMSDGIHKNFGTLRDFVERAQMEAASVIGCGWLWVVWHENRIEIRTTENTTTFPLAGGTVLLALDLWEHAYYRDFRSHRADYVAACLDKLINWDFANSRLRNALLGRKRFREITLAQDSRGEGGVSSGLGPAREHFPPSQQL
jgi:superoxide dismutase, Fe-Mn family